MPRPESKESWIHPVWPPAFCLRFPGSVAGRELTYDEDRSDYHRWGHDEDHDEDRADRNYWNGRHDSCRDYF